MAEPVRSLHGLLLRRLWLPLLCLLLCSGVGSFALARHYAGEVYDRWLLDSAMSLAELVHVRDGNVSMEVTPAVSRMFTWDTVDEIHGEVRTADGRRLYGDLEIALPAPDEVVGQAPVYYDAVLLGKPVRMVEVVVETLPGSDTWVHMRVAETLKKRARLEHKLLLSSIPFQGAILALAAWLAWSSTGAAARHTNGAARRLAAPRADALAPLDPQVEAPRELWPAVEAFNGLLQRLADMQGAQQRFVSNAAHQLRTPLAAMQVELESALREQDPPTRQAALAGGLANLTRLRHVVHQLLVLSRSEEGSGAVIPMQPVDLAALARDLLERFMDRAVAEGIDLGYEGPDHGAVVSGEPQLLREAIGNLLDNAMRYGERHGVVTLNVEMCGDTVAVVVDDSGAGIPEQSRAMVTERFFRGESNSEGCGLGLSIVSEIARLHGATLTFSSAPLGGARVRMEIGLSVNP